MAHFARIVVVIGLALPCQLLFAQLPAVRLDLITPAGGKTGSEIEVTITGTELEEADTLVFSHPGITATRILSDPDEIDTKPLPIPRHFLVKIASDVAPGIYEVRVNGPLGVTNPRAFAVGNEETLVKSGNHRTRETAMELPLGMAVTGSVEPGAFDYYRFSAKKSQPLLIDCYGQRIESRIDATLVLYDSEGTQIKHVRDVAQLDPVIEFVAPEDGEYYVGVHDFEYNGGSEYFYRLCVHEGPYVSFIFPPVGTSGMNGKFKIYGHNLPNGKPVAGMRVADTPLQELSVDVAMEQPASTHDFDVSLMETPGNSSMARKLFRLDTPNGKANPVSIGYATAPVWVENESESGDGTPRKLDIPCEFVGQFYPRGDRDVVLFDAKKGEEYWIELFSSRLGVPADAHMLIEKVTTDENGEQQVKLVAEVDDEAKSANANTQHVYFDSIRSDPSYRLTADADATYRVSIKDLFGNANNDPRFVYRLLIRKQVPDFSLLAYAVPITGDKNKVTPAATVLPRGGNTTLAVRIQRQHGFDGDIELSVQGLPDTVRCHGAIAGGKTNHVSLVFSATEEATAWTGPVTVLGKAIIGDREVTRQATGGAFIWGTQNAQQQQPVVRMVRDVTLAVIDRRKSPLTIQLGDGKPIEISRGGKMEIPVKAIRSEFITGDLKMKMVGVTGINLKDTVIKGTEGTYPLEVTAQNFPAGMHTVLLTGTAKYKFQGDADAIKKVEAESKRLEEVVKQFTEMEKMAQESLRKARETAAKEKENQSLADEVVKVQQESERLGELAKRAQQRKQQADKQLNDTRNRNKPRDVNLLFVSTPVRLQVTASPVTLNLDAPATMKQGDKTEVTAAIEKKYGFDEPVDITVELPGGVTGISAKPLKIEKGKSDGKLELQLAANATPGTHLLKVRSKLKFNNVNIDTSDEWALTIEAVEQAAGEKK